VKYKEYLSYNPFDTLLTVAHLSLFPVKAVGVILIHLRHQVLGTPTEQYLKVGTNENGSACGRWLSIGIYFALW
jgi:hypothetical protein